jgi:hypothetical protein
MARIAKKATQDGTSTIYVGETAVTWGLTSTAADMLIDRLFSRDVADRPTW